MLEDADGQIAADFDPSGRGFPVRVLAFLLFTLFVRFRSLKAAINSLLVRLGNWNLKPLIQIRFEAATLWIFGPKRTFTQYLPVEQRGHPRTRGARFREPVGRTPRRRAA